MTTQPLTQPLSPVATPPRVVVIGGGPAGLQAALTLGRLRRDVVLLDSGEYRNAATEAMHNVVSRDGTPPAAFRAAAREQLAAYDTVKVREARVERVERLGDRADDGFAVHLAGPGGSGGSGGSSGSGGERLEVDRVVLATGVRDVLPPTPGLEALWGTVVAHCPYCHGHEHTGRPVAVLGASPHVAVLVGLLGAIASSVTVLTDGAELPDAARAAVQGLGGEVREEKVVEVLAHGDGARLVLADGGVLDAHGVFVGTTLVQSAPFAEQLGLDLLPSGCVRVDDRGRTSVPGVYAAGDLAHVDTLPMPMASVLAAAGAGQLAASAVDADRLLPLLAG